MNVSIVYFSGTGNTAWVVQQLAERLRHLGSDVTTSSCEDVPAEEIDPGASDAFGILFPVHSSFAASIFRGYLAQLPAASTPLFAITTAGYWAGDTAWVAAQPLVDRGYDLFLCANVLMPNNFFIPKMDILPVTPPERVPRVLERAASRVAQLAVRIQRMNRHIQGTGPFGRLGGAIQRWGYATWESKMLARFHADESCIGCNWCVSHCPTQSWELRDGQARFLDSCIYCMRCYSFCPVQAIQATDRTRRTAKYRRYQGPQGRSYPA